MLVHNEQGFNEGYNSIAEIDGKHSDMLMDFGILKLGSGAVFEEDENKERAYLLMDGEMTFKWEGEEKKVNRTSLLDEAPHVLQVPAGAKVRMEAHSNVELCVQKVKNDNGFTPVYYDPTMVRDQRFGKGTMQDTSTRIVRTVFDADNAPFSGMVLGEVVNFPGKWSSYPPHNHPQPEIYHYRFPLATQGFGFGEVGDKVYKLVHESTLMITPWVMHPQVAAPGYPMYYIWMIPHLADAKFGPDSRQFLDEHTWLLDAQANIWSPQ